MRWPGLLGSRERAAEVQDSSVPSPPPALAAGVHAPGHAAATSP